MSGERGDADIAAFALQRGVDPSAALVRDPSEAVTAKQYEDWRTEVMGLATDQV